MRAIGALSNRMLTDVRGKRECVKRHNSFEPLVYDTLPNLVRNVHQLGQSVGESRSRIQKTASWNWWGKEISCAFRSREHARMCRHWNRWTRKKQEMKWSGKKRKLLQTATSFLDSRRERWKIWRFLETKPVTHVCVGLWGLIEGSNWWGWRSCGSVYSTSFTCKFVDRYSFDLFVSFFLHLYTINWKQRDVMLRLRQFLLKTGTGTSPHPLNSVIRFRKSPGQNWHCTEYQLFFDMIWNKQYSQGWKS